MDQQGLRRVLALGALGVWLGLLLAALLLGHRPATFADLKTVVALDLVERVTLTPGLDGREGSAVVEVTWRQGLLRFRTQVVEERPSGAGRAVRDEVTAAVDRPVAAVLHGIEPELVVETTTQPPPAFRVLGWDTPRGVDVVLAAAAGVVLWLLVTGPPPRRVTRWGWAWLVLLLPVAGAIAFLLLSGVLARGPAYATGARPSLTGGRALVVAVVVAAGGFLVGRILL